MEFIVSCISSVENFFMHYPEGRPRQQISLPSLKYNSLNRIWDISFRQHEVLPVFFPILTVTTSLNMAHSRRKPLWKFSAHRVCWIGCHRESFITLFESPARSVADKKIGIKKEERKPLLPYHESLKIHLQNKYFTFLFLSNSKK